MTDGIFAQCYGPWAVVTGASSGIGEAFARLLAERGVNLVIAARRQERLESLARDLRGFVDVDVVVVDLAADGGPEALLDATETHDVGLLVCNAGFGMKGPFLDLSLAEQRRMLRLNCEATLVLSHGFGERLAARGRGGIIVTSSTAAFQGTPATSAYAATKGFCLQLAEGMWDELQPHGVDVLALCPGATDTEGPRRTGVDMDAMPIKPMTGRAVALAALENLGRRPAVVPGWINLLSAFATRFVPRAVATRVAGRAIRRVTRKR